MSGMRACAVLCWFDEPVHFLHRCVTSLGQIADTLIAYDGAWELFPGGKPYSDPMQAAAIESAADDAGIECVIFTPDTTWGSQVEKRAALMLEAGETGADWLMVIDGDEYVADHAPPAMIRAALEGTQLDVATINHTRTTGVEAVNTPGAIRRLYRASCGVTVDTGHNGYRTMDGRWLHGSSSHVPLEPALDLTGMILLHHERLNRGDERNRASLDYYSARLRLNAEDWKARRAAA